MRLTPPLVLRIIALGSMVSALGLGIAYANAPQPTQPAYIIDSTPWFLLSGLLAQGIVLWRIAPRCADPLVASVIRTLLGGAILGALARVVWCIHQDQWSPFEISAIALELLLPSYALYQLRTNYNKSYKNQDE